LIAENPQIKNCPQIEKILSAKILSAKILKIVRKKFLSATKKSKRTYQIIIIINSKNGLVLVRYLIERISNNKINL